MKNAFKRLLLASLMVACASAFADDMTEADAAKSAAAQEWRTYIQPMEGLGEQFVPLLSDAQDPQVRRELYRSIFGQIALAYLDVLFVDPLHPEFVPYNNPAFTSGGPNPDNVYYMAPINSDGIYKISGTRGTVFRIDFQVGNGSFVPRGQMDKYKGGLTLSNFDLDSLKVKKNARFEVVLSKERPEGYKGNWWKLEPGASYLLARQISYDWLHEVDGRLRIERLDTPAIKPRQTVEELDANLKQVSKWAEDTMKLSLGFIRVLRKEMGINQLKYKDLSEYGGLKTQKYAYGGFDLAPDEALLVEAKMPQHCRYVGMGLLNDYFFTMDYANHQSSLNGYTAKADKDGVLRIVISAQDPGVPNWLDTQGWRTGAIQVRWDSCTSWPDHIVTKIKTADLRNYVPATTPMVSPAMRDAALKDRREGAQLRKRW